MESILQQFRGGRSGFQVRKQEKAVVSAQPQLASSSQGPGMSVSTDPILLKDGEIG